MAVLRQKLATLILGVSLVGCAGTDGTSGSSPPTNGSTDPTVTTPSTDAPTIDVSRTTPPPVTTAAAPTTVDSTSTTMPTAVTTTTTTTTTSQPAATTTTVDVDGSEPPPADPIAVSVDIPTGEFLRAPGDLVVMRTNGDLEYRPNALSPGNQAPPILLLDRADPRPKPEEGPRPNTISDVAAFLHGSAVYGECCEPVSGNVFVVDAPGSDVGPVAVGYLIDQSPDGSRLATASDIQISVVDVDSSDGNGLILQQTPDQRYSIIDIEWADNDTLMAIMFDGQDHRIVAYDAANLIASPVRAKLDSTVGFEAVRFVGRSPLGHVVLATTVGSDSSWEVRYLKPSSYEEDAQLRQNFPSSVSNIEIDARGLGQIWVDGETLYYLPRGRFEARPIDTSIRAAWFVESG